MDKDNTKQLIEKMVELIVELMQLCIDEHKEEKLRQITDIEHDILLESIKNISYLTNHELADILDILLKSSKDKLIEGMTNDS